MVNAPIRIRTRSDTAGRKCNNAQKPGLRKCRIPRLPAQRYG